MKLLVLPLVLLLVSTAGGTFQADYACEYEDCVEGTTVYFNVTVTANASEFVPEEKWKPRAMLYSDIEILSDETVVAAFSGSLNLTNSSPSASFEIMGSLPNPIDHSITLTMCFNRSESGDIYAASVGKETGFGGGSTHSRDTFLLSWSRYAKPPIRICGQFATLAAKPRSEVECLEDPSCRSEERCIDYVCRPLECGECESADDHACVPYDCCSSESCPIGEECTSHECKGLDCREGQTEEAHACRDVICGLFQKGEGTDCTWDLPLIIGFIFVVVLVLLLLIRPKRLQAPRIRLRQKWYER
jgi:hypothetical protein